MPIFLQKTLIMLIKCSILRSVLFGIVVSSVTTDNQSS